MTRTTKVLIAVGVVIFSCGIILILSILGSQWATEVYWPLPVSLSLLPLSLVYGTYHYRPKIKNLILFLCAWFALFFVTLVVPFYISYSNQEFSGNIIMMSPASMPIIPIQQSVGTTSTSSLMK